MKYGGFVKLITLLCQFFIKFCRCSSYLFNRCRQQWINLYISIRKNETDPRRDTNFKARSLQGNASVWIENYRRSTNWDGSWRCLYATCWSRYRRVSTFAPYFVRLPLFPLLGRKRIVFVCIENSAEIEEPSVTTWMWLYVFDQCVYVWIYAV